jgi:hypothetical protein
MSGQKLPRPRASSQNSRRPQRAGKTAASRRRRMRYNSRIKPLRGSTVSTTRHTLDELANLGRNLFEQHVRPVLRPEDDGKFIAIDIETGDYEIDEDDYAAVRRLQSRKPAADVWLMRAGYPATCRIGAVQ